MHTVKAGLFAALLLFIAQPVMAVGVDGDDAIDQFKDYMNTMVAEVKAADDPDEKRAILDEGMKNMQRAIDLAQQYPQVASAEKEGLEALRANLADKRAQLNGDEDYERIADVELDEFADYVQQDMEQAQRLVLSLGVTTLLLLIIILLLIG